MHCVKCIFCCIAEQREFEASLKKRKRDFGETLERYESEVDKYAQRSELSKRDEVAAQVTDLSQKLKEVSLVHHNKPHGHVQHSLLHMASSSLALGIQLAQLVALVDTIYCEHTCMLSICLSLLRLFVFLSTE